MSKWWPLYIITERYISGIPQMSSLTIFWKNLVPRLTLWALSARYYRGCHSKKIFSALQMVVTALAIMHINEKTYSLQPSNVITPKLLKNAENRSVETAENVLTYGGSFALKDFLPTSKLWYPLCHSVPAATELSLTRPPSLSRNWTRITGWYYASSRSFQKSHWNRFQYRDKVS